MAQDYLNDIVQNIITRCDLSDLHLLMDNVDDLEKKVKKLGRAFNKAMTGEEQIALAQANAQIAKSNEVISWNTVLRRQQDAAIAKSNETISWNNKLKAENNNETKLAYQETSKKLSQDRKDIQLSKERTAQLNRENRARQRGNALLRTARRLFFAYFGINTIRSVVNTYRNLDLIRRSIEGLTQSTQDWEYIQKEAFRTATDIETVATGYRNFYSAATMAGMDKDSVQTMYSGILEAGRAVGATQPQIKGALLALEQMFSKGKVSMEELRRQLGNALPGAFEVAAKAMGVTTEEFNKMIEKGIQAKELVPKFTEEYRKTFAKSFPEAMKSLDAALVNLDTSWKLFQYNILYGENGRKFAETLVKISKFLQSKDALKLAEDVGKLFQGLVKVLEVILNIGEYLLQWKPVLLIGALIFGVKSLNVELLTTMAIAAKIVAAFAFIEELIVGFGQHFLGWNAKSNIGDALDNMLGAKGEDLSRRVQNSNIDELAGVPSIIKNDRKLRKQYIRMMRSGDQEGMMQMLQKYHSNMSTPNMKPTYMSTFADRPSTFQKEENIDNSVTMGDLHFNITAIDPQGTANEISNIFNSYLYKNKNGER